MFKLNEKLLRNHFDEDKEQIQENKYYKHCDLFIDLMNNNVDNLSFKHIFLCGFNINFEGKYPFIHFLFMEKNNEYGLIELEKNEFTNKTIEETINLCINKINILNLDCDYYGLYNYNNNIYVFLKIYEKKKNKLGNKKYITKCILDEIINTKKIYDIHIEEQSHKFFIENINMFLLYDEDNKQYEIPSSFFMQRENKLIQNTSSLYTSKGDLFSVFGPYYYFTNYKNAIRQNKEKLVRVALFLGKQLVKMNYPDDEIDNSYIKQARLKESNLIKKEMLTMRITDYDGVWTNNYDSVYIGNIILDDGTIYENNCLCVMNDKTRCIILTD